MIPISCHDHSQPLPEGSVRVPGKDMPDANDSKELAVRASDSDITFFPYVYAQLLGLPQREQRYACSRIEEDCGLCDFLL